VTSGAIDSFASTVLQAVLLVLLLVFSESSLALELPFPSGDSRTLLWILVGLVLTSALVLAGVRRLRETILGNNRRWWPDVRSALAGLRASNKLALLVFGSLATEVLFAAALGLFAAAWATRARSPSCS
jgi:membrane protease YdiL (CAAX protease family)